MIRQDIYQFLSNESECLKWCIQQGLVQTESNCPKCRSPMKLSQNRKFLRCNKSVLGKKCNQKKNLLSHSFFDGSKISIAQILLIIYEWSVDSSVERTATETGVSCSTVSGWFSKLRIIVSFHWAAKAGKQIGGSGCIVEMDECCLVRRKYNRGRILSGQQQWIFGGICRETKESFITFVPNRKRETLLEKIKEKVAPGSTIITDCWKGYLDLETILADYNFKHLTVNHSESFVSPRDGSHTQTIEGFWSAMKRKLRMKGTYHGSMEMIFDKIEESRYKKAYSFHVFGQIIKDIIEFTN